jgi:hypothetical protein
VLSINYFGTRTLGIEHEHLMTLLKKRLAFSDMEEYLIDEGRYDIDKRPQIEEIDRELIPMEAIYRLKGQGNTSELAPCTALDEIGRRLGTDWSICVGIDRADPLKSRTAARTMIVVVAKGLPGSLRQDRFLAVDDGAVPNYFYLLLHVHFVHDHSLEGMKTQLQRISDEYDGIDTICSERWGIWDLGEWTKDKLDTTIEMIPSATYDRQRAAFSEVYKLVDTGRLKGPPSGCAGTNGDDIIEEEMSIFDHDPDARWFGSPEKKDRHGVQDDSMYALAWGIYGGRFLNTNDFRQRKTKMFFGQRILPVGLIGSY